MIYGSSGNVKEVMAPHGLKYNEILYDEPTCKCPRLEGGNLGGKLYGGKRGIKRSYKGERSL